MGSRQDQGIRATREKEPRRAGSGIWLSLLSAILLVSHGSSAAETSPWSLDKQENGIDVYTRPIEDSGIKEFKGVAEVEASVDDIFGLLRDSDRFKTWFPNCPESKSLGREGDVSYQYSVMSIPWPISDRDNIFRATSERDEETGTIVVHIEAAPDYYPKQSGRVRVKRANGTWLLEPLSEQSTRVTFTMHLEPGGGIPDWMINARVVATPFEALTNLRTTLGR